MKTIFLLFAFLVGAQFTFSQECDYNFKVGTFLITPIDVQAGDEQKTLNKIQQLKTCLAKTEDAYEQYWLSSSIANQAASLQKTDDMVKYSELAYNKNQELFCREYVSTHDIITKNEGMFQDNYLDVATHPTLVKIKTYCKNNYLQAHIDMIEAWKQKKLAEKNNANFNTDYANALVTLYDKDQAQRQAKELNWDKQHQLDLENRVELDRLYNLYGFPTKDKVGTDGIMNAFLILHHSEDCEWNEKWTERFLNHISEFPNQPLFSLYLYRNFNSQYGICINNIEFYEQLKLKHTSPDEQKLFDFSQHKEN